MRVHLLVDHAIDGKWELAGAVLTVSDELGRALVHQGYAEPDEVRPEKAVRKRYATAARRRPA